MENKPTGILCLVGRHPVFQLTEREWEARSAEGGGVEGPPETTLDVGRVMIGAREARETTSSDQQTLADPPERREHGVHTCF